MPLSARPFFTTLAAAAMMAGQAHADAAETDVEAVVVTGSRLANASINGLEIETLRLPQNVRVLREDLIQATGIANLSDLFDYAGGMARQNSFGGAWDAYAIRGFSGDINQGPDLLVNRFTANRGFNPRRDVASIEVFQVLKGPASALSGKGEPGGSINIVTKAPRDVQHASLEAGYGSHDTRRGVVDLGGPLGQGVGVRLVGAYQATDGFRDFVGSERLFLAPSLNWRPTDALTLLYQLEYADVDFVHDRGIVAINGDGKALPGDRFLGEPNDGRIKQRTWQHQGSLTWDLADNMALEAGVQYRDGDFVGQSTHNSVLVGTQLRRQLRVHDYFWDDLSGRVEFSGRFAGGGMEHQIRAGADAFTFEQRRIFFRFNPTAANPYAIDVLRPVYGQPKPAAPLNQDILEDLRGESIYIQDLITLGRQFSVLVGLRHDWIHQTNTNFRNGAVTRQSPSETSPRAAFTWAPSETLSVYASWGRSFRYNQGADAVGGAFPAERGEALEAGVKYALLDGRLTGTASIFRIEKENVLVNDPANPGFSTPAGEARSKGFEADLNFAVDRNLTLTAVYALTDSEITRDTRAFLAGSGLSNVPKHSAAMFGTWRSGQDGSGEVTVSAGLVYVGDRPGDDVASGFELPDYVTARLNIGYQVTERLSAHLDIENLFDTYYLESSFSNVWIAPGAARTVTARVRWSY